MFQPIPCVRLLAVLLTLVSLGGCMTEQRVLVDHSVAAQFAQFDGKSGFQVSSAATRKKAEKQRKAEQFVPVANNNDSFFGGPVHWTTDLKLDDPKGAPKGDKSKPGPAASGYVPGLGLPPAGSSTPDNGLFDPALAPGPAPAMMGPAGPAPSAPGSGDTSSAGPLPGR